jgi:hypothetical protein
MDTPSDGELLTLIELLCNATLVKRYYADLGPNAGKYKYEVDGLYLTTGEAEFINKIINS